MLRPMVNWLRILIFSVLVLKSIGLIESEIKSIDKFPHPVDKSFSILIKPRDDSCNGSLDLYKTIVISIVSSEGKISILDKAIFDYGFNTFIDQPNSGTYMTNLHLAKDYTSNIFNMSFKFSLPANGKGLEVHRLCAKTVVERKRLLENLANSNILLDEKVRLLAQPRINLTILSPTLSKNQLLTNELGTATCRSFDGIPTEKPVFSGLRDSAIKKNEFISDKNERKIQFSVSAFDHEKNLTCSAGGSEASSIMLVLHHPTQVTLDYEPGPLLENGSSVACLKADGYPLPAIWWTFVSGPANASFFFNFSKNSTKFHLSKDAPLQSRWTLNCSASNIIQGSYAVYNRTITFIVGRPEEGLFARFKRNIRIIGIVVFVLFFLVIVVVTIIARRSCVGGVRGASNTASSMEKVQIVPDLPALPPKYELVANEDFKRPAQLEVNHDVERAYEGPTAPYDEVIYEDGTGHYDEVTYWDT